ncbi:psychosine receptor isoform X2 [Prionailurus viverrinus]|uniref:psychosine receptor isoform X2 n=1 Tax=Prionailurus viverrinus TaxID=61388 RepID=UPI001FF16D3D|nr:psychosine receptor isoform X2 [Prionailurus viverrinus]XP_047718391.1 psychosine receptor isoform X2 [Prionailurus viverrinus]XP_047718392.1 psychosine receptor isoform X2 [Prionailurus viverrinus]XP_047718393.1 psychosine receptor isoform X2 [Prionailurus viverrinus]XP_047718394.1 psychosine receptor isoform X2 [Prionailurus viverrinus]XP_047718395.1 psychosine receptor isoform X2 [Prionailurus viverrinus]XP_047718397.1 psychosine receptor isoform X2 [Prionailurus viverrinus]
MKQEQPPGDMGLNEIQVLVSHLGARRFIWLLGRQNHLLEKHGKPPKLQPQRMAAMVQSSASIQPGSRVCWRRPPFCCYHVLQMSRGCGVRKRRRGIMP